MDGAVMAGEAPARAVAPPEQATGRGSRNLIIAVRLANEGVPLAAMARALQLPRELVRHELLAARHAGDIGAMPAEDWPPGQRGMRVAGPIPVARPHREGRLDFEARTIRLFVAMEVAGVHLTDREARLLLLLADRDFCSKGWLHESLAPEAEPKIVDVFICKLRAKMRPLQLRIGTVWGRGYRMPAVDRARVQAWSAGVAAQDAEPAA